MKSKICLLFSIVALFFAAPLVASNTVTSQSPSINNMQNASSGDLQTLLDGVNKPRDCNPEQIDGCGVED